MNLTVNDNASGAWSRRVGMRLVYVGPGINRFHVIVRRPACRKSFGIPTRWVDGLTDPEPIVTGSGQYMLGV